MSAVTTEYNFLEVGCRIRLHHNLIREVVWYEKIIIGSKDGKEYGYTAVKTKPITLVDPG